MVPTVKGSQCLVGWRGWRVLHPNFLVGGNLVYEPRKRHEAHCNSTHLAPDIDCSCGIYSFKTFDDLRRQGYINQDILGEVYLWGRVIECERGYKAQYAYPKKLYIGNPQQGVLGVDVEALAPYIGYLYGVEIEVNTRIARIASRNYFYNLTSEGQQVQNLYRLPPRQILMMEILQRLQRHQSPVSKQAFMSALQGSPDLQTPVIPGYGRRDSGGAADPWKQFLRVEESLIDRGYLTRTFGEVS